MNKGRKLTEREIEEIVRLRREGYKIRHIAERLNINKNTVVKYCKKAYEN